jgi:hypothetical protein
MSGVEESFQLLVGAALDEIEAEQGHGVRPVEVGQ